MSWTSDANLLAEFLAADEGAATAVVLVLIGSSIVYCCEQAARTFLTSKCERMVIAGGVGHSTDDLRRKVAPRPEFAGVNIPGMAESEIFREIVVSLGVPSSLIQIETVSRNCGANAWESKPLIADAPSVLLVQDPTMQRRTHASFLRAYRGERAPEIRNWPTFVPRLDSEGHFTNSGVDTWPLDRFLSLLLGEIPRLSDDANGYGPNGKDFIEHVDIPHEVEQAYRRLSEQFAPRS